MRRMDKQLACPVALANTTAFPHLHQESAPAVMYDRAGFDLLKLRVLYRSKKREGEDPCETPQRICIHRRLVVVSLQFIHT